jgi:uncharacterized protein YcnI
LSYPRRRLRRLVLAAAGIWPLVAAGPVWAHAEISPPVAMTGVTQMFTLAVPTEKEDATTTEVQLTVPDGVSIDSLEPTPGWQRSLRTSGGGHEAAISQVTWTGGHVPSEEDAVFRFLASLTGGDKSYSFGVRQTYSDGSVVEWNGAESSNTPSPTVEGVSDLGSGSGSSTLAVVALIVGGAGVLLGLVGLLAGRRSLT